MQSFFPNSPCYAARRIGSLRAHPRFRTLPVLSMLLGILLAVTSSGCRISNSCCPTSIDMPANLQKTSLEPLPITDIQAIRLPFVGESEKGMIPDGFAEAFPLTIQECEELAARKSPLAAVLEVENTRNGPCQPCSQVDPCVADSVNSIVQDNSNYQRNLAAEKALLAYLGLVEVYLQYQIANETITEIEDLEAVLEKLQEEDLLPDLDPEKLVRKRLEIVATQNDLLFNFESLNEKLRALLGLERSVHPIWTDCQIADWQIPANAQEEIKVALEKRSDLQALSRLSSLSNDQVMETLRSSVRSASPLAGLVLQRKLFGGYFSDNCAEIDKLRTQLTILLAAQTDLVSSTVSEHFYEVYKNRELIRVNQSKLDSLRKSEARLEARRQVGPVDVEEVLNTKSQILECRSAIIHSAVDLQRSWLKLKAAQGLLGQGLLGQAAMAIPAAQLERGSGIELIEPRTSLQFNRRLHSSSYSVRR